MFKAFCWFHFLFFFVTLGSYQKSGARVRDTKKKQVSALKKEKNHKLHSLHKD